MAAALHNRQMHFKHCTLLVLSTMLASGCATGPNDSGATLASAKLMSIDGTDVGTATVARVDGTPTLSVSIEAIGTGVHGIHLHAVGKCEGPAFSTAGGHLNPGNRQHGVENPAGSHLGDLPNLAIDANGRGKVISPLRTQTDLLVAQVFDADGTAIVVHAAPDDYRTDPSGNSGARIACGVFTRP